MFLYFASGSETEPSSLLDLLAPSFVERANQVDEDEVVKLLAEKSLFWSKVVKLYQEHKAPKRQYFVLKLIVLIAIGWCI
ncbi:hypothetical protein Syun_025394 [Stephania yunnanensis]|uniref:Uncharacterized protein n=1 Tax=Stephania yunnanensis TaxID=152371 RepID=A0AAP0F0H1_9MAGN